jgi:hypothetical protein
MRRLWKLTKETAMTTDDPKYGSKLESNYGSELTVPLRPQEQVEPVDPTLEREREIAQQAAIAVDRWGRERIGYQQMIEQARAGLEAKNREIAELHVLLDQKIGDLHAQLDAERQQTQIYRCEADELVKKNAWLEVGLANAKAILEALALPLPPEKRRRRKSDLVMGDPRGGGSAMPDANGGAPEVAEGEAVLAHRAPVLGQLPEVGRPVRSQAGSEDDPAAS